MKYLPPSAIVPHQLEQRFNQGCPQKPQAAWDKFRHKKVVKDALYARQYGLCAYCENRLDTELGNHIEHIQPKTEFPDQTFAYNNLMLSCIDSTKLNTLDSNALSCGHHKLRQYDAALFIHPTDADCEEYFFYSLTGEITSNTAAQQQKVDYTVDILNLNCRRLTRERSDLLQQGFRFIQELQADNEALQNFLALEFAVINGKLPIYINARKQHFSDFLTV